MGMLSGMLKTGAAKKMFDEARKPHNQAKAKDLFRSVTGKGQQPGNRPPGSVDRGPNGPDDPTSPAGPPRH